MTCDLKKLGCFISSLPEKKPSVLMMLAGMSTMLMWESVMRMHTTALAPGLLVKRDLNIQKWHRGLSHVKPETLTVTGGGMVMNWGGGLHHTPLFLVVSLTHQREDTLLASIRATDTCPVYRCHCLALVMSRKILIWRKKGSGFIQQKSQRRRKKNERPVKMNTEQIMYKKEVAEITQSNSNLLQIRTLPQVMPKWLYRDFPFHPVPP